MKTKTALIKTAAGYDLLNSLLKAAPCSFLCALLLSFCFFFSAVDAKKAYYHLFFSSSSESLLTFTQYALVAAGLMTALFLFRFLGSSPQTNVLLSSGISRQRIFWNRVLAGVGALSLGVFLPLTATLCVNIYAYGLKSYMLKPYLLYLLSALALALIGFCAGLLAAVLAGSTVEAAAAACILPSFPFVLFSFVTYCLSTFLKGYQLSYKWADTAFYSKTYFLSPWHLLSVSEQVLNPSGYISYSISSNIWNTFSKISAKSGLEFIDPYTALKIPSSLLIIFAAWIAALGLVVLFSYFLFLKRKAEINSHLRGSKGIAALLSSFFVAGAATLGLSALFVSMTSVGSDLIYFGGSPGTKALCWLSFFLPGTLALIICLAIYAGSLKRFRALLKLSSLCLLILVVPLICVLGGFGYVGRVPKAADIQNVYLNGLILPESLSSMLLWEDGLFESDGDKQRVINVHEKTVGRGKAYPAFLQIAYTMKDGGRLFRSYYFLNADALGALGGLFESDVLRTYFFNQIGDKSTWRSAEEIFALRNEDIPKGPYPQNNPWLRFGDASLSLSASAPAANSAALDKLLTEESFDRLLSCYASDLTDLSTAEFLTPSQPPVYALVFTTGLISVVNNEKQHHDFYVTAGMKRTLAFLSSLGVTLSAPQKVVKEITLYACRDAGLLDPERQFTDYFIENQLGEPVKTITDPAEIKEMTANLYPYYLSDGQNVQYARIVYNDGSSEYYLLKD